MRTVRLLGELGKKFGEVHRFSVNTPAEAVRALAVNFPGFENELRTAHERNVGFKVINGGEELEDVDQVHQPASREIVIAPVVMGSGAVARILIGAVLIVASFIPGLQGASPYLLSAGAGLLLGGVVELLSPVPRAPKVPEKPENTPSYVFNGPVNTTAQGHPVPVGYGRMTVGGALISAGISVRQLRRGFIEKQVERVIVRTRWDSGAVYGPFPPRNYYKKTLERGRGIEPGGSVESNFEKDTYYFYETILVEA